MEPAPQASDAQREARDRAILRACVRLPAALLLVTAAYAATRYVVFGPWSIGHIPLYVLNKAFAWTGIVLLALALGLGPAARLWPALGAQLWRRRWWGLVGFALATVHILVSLAILNYGYYRLMFQQAFELTPLAEGAMLAVSAGAQDYLVKDRVDPEVLRGLDRFDARSRRDTARAGVTYNLTPQFDLRGRRNGSRGRGALLCRRHEQRGARSARRATARANAMVGVFISVTTVPTM